MAITRVSKPKSEKKTLEPSEKPQRSVKERQLTGMDIIKLYLQGNQSVRAKYQHLYMSIEHFTSWDNESKVASIGEFLPLADVMNGCCVEVIKRLCQLPWVLVPESIRPSFVDFLCKIGIAHFDNLHHVLDAIALQFIPVPPQEPLEDCQEKVYQSAHQCLKTFIQLFPPNFIASPLLAACKKNFPNIVYCDPERFHAYVCNMVRLVHQVGEGPLAESLWAVIMERVFY